MVAGGTRQVLVGNATYLPAGPASSWQFGTTRTLTRTYDQDYRATGVQDPGTGGLDIGYVYDNASYLKQITTQSTAAIRAKFDYDALGRLLDRKNAADVIQESYTYDGTGNRLSNAVGGTTTTNTYLTTNHRLTQVGAVARTYDNVGNLTAIGGTTREYGYNDANRMSLAKSGGVLQATYLYNGFGEQVQRQTGVTTRFVYDEGGSLLGQYDSTGAVVQEYVYLGGVPIGTILSTAQGTGNARLKWVQTDALGTPRAIIDPTRSLAIWRWDENGEAFGNSSPNTDPDADGTNVVFDLRFPGQRYDQASGLYYNYYRDYDPSVGRYVQSDPVGLIGGVSTYGYVGGMPTVGVDPAGLASCGIWQDGCRFNPRFSMTWDQAATGFEIGVVVGLSAIGVYQVGGTILAATRTLFYNLNTLGVAGFGVAYSQHADEINSLAESFFMVAGGVDGPSSLSISGVATAEAELCEGAKGSVSKGWRVGADIYSETRKGAEPAWSTVRSRFWKNEAAAEGAAERYGAENMSRMRAGLAPQRFNADKGGIESMELSHEPIPIRDGGKEVVPRWPQDHAAIDPYRYPGY